MKTDTRPAAEIAAELNDPATTRTQALATVTLVKGDRIAALARLLRVATRGLKAHEVRDRIVDATVGARLTLEVFANSCGPRPSELLPAARVPADPARVAVQTHARLADYIRHITATLHDGAPTDPAVIAELAAAAAELAEVATARR